MGLSYNQLDEGILGGLTRFRLLEITFDNSYASGGEPVSADEIGLQSISAMMLGTVDQDSAGYVVQYDKQVGKLRVFRSAGFTPAGTVAAPTFSGSSVQPSFTVKNGTILANGTMGLDADAASAHVVGGTGITADRTLTTTSPVGAITPAGTNSAPAFSGAAVAAAALVEVTAAVDLSALTVTALVLGF